MSRPAAVHQMISASAGSGKTYRLTNRYLSLLADGVSPTQVWATTFTRKAAGEILDRILSRLTDASASEVGARRLATALDRSEITQADCIRWLRALLSEIHRLRIGTMDSLFQGLAGAFAMELGLPAGWSVADKADVQAEFDAALDDTLSGDGRRLDELARLYERLSPFAARRGVRYDLLEKIESLYSAFLAVPAAGWQTTCGAKPAVALDTVMARAEGVAIEDKRAIKALAKDLEQARAGHWEDFIGGGMAAKVVSRENAYYKKPLPADLVDCYRQMIELAWWHIRQAGAAELAATHEFLREFHRHIRQIKDSGRGIEFDDVTRALVGRLSALESGLFYRIDSSIGHLLLDEFQDTSTLQWHVVEPLSRMVASAGGSVFAVGDSKQAIFGWRGGRVELFDRLPGLLGGIEPETMDESRRSAQVIIQGVNSVFQNLADALPDEPLHEAATDWRSRFREHTTAKADLPGYLLVETGPRQDENDSTDDHRGRHYHWVAERIAGIVRDHPTATVGVLCRKNRTVARLVYELRELGVPASQEGGNPITDSAAVEGILSLLTLADHPGDSVAAFHLATEPFATVFRAHGYDPTHVGETARQVRNDLMTLGYGPVVARLATDLKAIGLQSDRDRLDQLMEVADAYEHRATLRPSDFVSWVRQYKSTALVPGLIRVLTLHTAKGLEYDAVVLPELDIAFSEQPKPFVAADPDPPKLPDGFVGRRVTSALRPLADAVAIEQTDLATRRAVQESMSLLYVALTRPRQGLYIFPPGPQRRERQRCWDAAVLHGLCPDRTIGVTERPEKTVLLADGDSDWQPKRDTESIQHPEPAAAPPNAPAAPLWRPREWVAPSHVLEARRRVPAASLFADANAANRRAGDLHHAWFAAIEWLDDGEPSDDALRRLATDFRLSDAELAEQMATFRKALRLPALRAVFSKTGHPECVRLERERPFAVREGEQLIVGRIDRLVWSHDKSGETAAEVIDFKTDDIRSEAVPMRSAHYRPQIEAYLRATATFGRIPMERITGTIVFTVHGHIERVSLAGEA